MRIRSFIIDKKKKQNLNIQHEEHDAGLGIYVNEQKLGTVEGIGELKNGKSFSFEHMNYFIRLNGEKLKDLIVTQNFKNLKPSSDDPVSRINAALFSIFFVAVVSLSVAILNSTSNIPAFQALGDSFDFFLNGSIFLILGIIILKRSSSVIVITAFALYVLDSLGSFLFADSFAFVTAIPMRILFAVSMFKGIRGARELKGATTFLTAFDSPVSDSDPGCVPDSPSSQKNDNNDSLENGISLVKQKEYSTATKIFDSIIRSDDSNKLAYYYRAVAHLRTGDQLTAKADLIAAARLGHGKSANVLDKHKIRY